MPGTRYQVPADVCKPAEMCKPAGVCNFPSPSLRTTSFCFETKSYHVALAGLKLCRSGCPPPELCLFCLWSAGIEGINHQARLSKLFYVHMYVCIHAFIHSFIGSFTFCSPGCPGTHYKTQMASNHNTSCLSLLRAVVTGVSHQI